MKTQVDVHWLHTHLHDPDLRILDASWALDGTDRRPYFETCHIEGAQFFDIEAVSDKASDLPHMAPTETQFADAVGSMGISHQNIVIIYDQFGLFSAARIWWTFRLMGHERVFVLKGGLPAWIAANYATRDQVVLRDKVIYLPKVNPQLMINIRDLKDISYKKDTLILDARPQARFLGKAPEPRAGLRSGHMPGSVSLPFDRLIEGGALREKSQLIDIFDALGIAKDQPVVTTCGSGITAAILSMALCECGYPAPRLYDGSWAQWGREDSDTIVLSSA
jgi:thiosulfate/3-mercaptopyruvate sulfurtransferase